MCFPLPDLQSALIVSLVQSASGDLPGEVARILKQLPDPDSLVAGTLVAIPDGPQQRRRLLPNWRQSPPRIERSARCTALLAKGFVRVGGGTAKDGVDWSWGFVSMQPRERSVG